ncbi:fluoride efflux transporter FluC [Solibacillus silvestris]|uniref:fluoride efflux transporter FluC n=1 Tax=Solibacillus silvestris TaxID=76853 RepID=UPI003F80BD55
MIYFLVGIAGSIGAAMRYMTGIMFYTNSTFPYTTLSINLIGSFLLAWLSTNLFKRFSVTTDVRVAIETGFVGSFTTFSAVSIETVRMFESDNAWLAILYIFSSIVGGVLMSRLGFNMKKEVKSL